MKYNFSFSLALLLCLSITLLAQDKDFTITASIKKYPSDAKAYLFYKSTQGRLVDSAEIEKGSFTFHGKIDEPRPAMIAFMKPGEKNIGQQRISFYIEPGDLVFTSKSMLSTASISGSSASLEKKEFDKLGANLVLGSSENVTVRTTQKVSVISGSGPSSGPVQSRGRTMTGGPSTSTRTVTDISQLPMEVQLAIRGREEEAKNKALKFIKEHPKSFVSLYTLNTMWTLKKISYGEYYAMLNVIDPSLLQSNEGKVMFGQ